MCGSLKSKPTVCIRYVYTVQCTGVYIITQQARFLRFIERLK